MSKMDQTWSKWIFHQSKNVAVKSCHIYRKDKNARYIFDFFWIRSVQNGWNLVKLDKKLDQIGFLRQSKNVPIKNCHIYRKDKNGCFVFDIFGSDLSKMDQTWSQWISHQSKNVTLKSCHFFIFLDQICPKWIKLDQIGFFTNLKMLL